MLDSPLLHQLIIITYQSTSLQLQNYGLPLHLFHHHHHLYTAPHHNIAFILSSVRLLPIICRPATTNRCYPGPQRMHVGCKVKMPTCCGLGKRPNGGESYPFLTGPFTSMCGRPRPEYNHHQHSTRICRRNI